MTPLRKKMLDYLLIKGYAAATIKSYIHHVQLFALHYNSYPSKLNLEDVQLYLAYLVKEKQYSQSSINGAYSAIKILFENIMEKAWDSKKIPRSKRRPTLPNVLSKKEVTINEVDHRANISKIWSKVFTKICCSS